MEWCSESHRCKKFKRGIEDENMQPKSLLYLFIEYAWDEGDGQLSGCKDIDLKNWLTSQTSNTNDEIWLLSNKQDVRIAPRVQSEDGINVGDNDQPRIRDFNNKIVYAKIAYNLRKVLTFLINSNDNINYTGEDGRTILQVFLEEYHKSTVHLAQEDLLKMQILINKLKARGTSLYALDKRGKGPIHGAAMCKNNQVLEVVISCLSDVNECDEKGNTALQIILENCVDQELNEHKIGYIHIVQSLVCRGADFNIKNKKGMTAIHLAAEKFHIDFLKLFADNGADLKGRSDEDETPLHCACKSSLRLRDSWKMIETIDFFVSQGCDLEAVDKEGFMPLHYAAEFGNIEVVQRLIELGAHVDCQMEKTLMTPLHLAAKANRLDVMKKLVEVGANVNVENVDGATPIFMSVLLGSFQSMFYLIGRGADIYRRDKLEGCTLLHLAAGSVDSRQLPQVGIGTSKKLNFLIEKGLDVNDPGTYNITPLHWACIAFKVDAVKSLVDHGANVNFQSDKSELTALHIASIDRSRAIVEILIEAGADVNCRGGSQQSTPLHFILMKDIKWHLGNVAANDEESFKESPMRKIWPKYNCTLKFLAFDVFTLLMKNGADVNAKDASGRCPLYFATLRSDSRLSKILLESGAHVHVQDNEGQSYLANALKKNNIVTLRNLLDFGADINDQDICQQIMNSKDDLKKVVFEHAIKLKVLGLPLAKIYEMPIQELNFMDFQTQCLEEVVALKNYYIDDFTLYQFLQFNVKRQYFFVGKISSLYENLEKLFPLYFGIIRGVCCEAAYRKPLLELARIAWPKISKIHLPYVCVENMLAHLNNRYLDALVVSAKPDQNISTSESKKHVIAGCTKKNYP